MTETFAYLKKLRIAPRKVGLVLDQIRNLPPVKAVQILDHLPQKSAQPLRKLINSAIANAAHNQGLEPSALVIKQLYVTPGPTLKRMRPRAQGRSFRIRKRTSHVTVCLRSEQPTPTKKLIKK